MDPNLGQSLDLLSLSLFSIFVPAVLLNRDNSGSEILTVGWPSHPSTWCPVFLLEMDSTLFLSPLLGISSKVPPFESWDSLTSQIWYILEPPTPPPTFRGYIFPFILLALGAKLLVSPDHLPLFPCSSLSSLFPSSLPFSALLFHLRSNCKCVQVFIFHIVKL